MHLALGLNEEEEEEVQDQRHKRLHWPLFTSTEPPSAKSPPSVYIEATGSMEICGALSYECSH